MPRSKTNPNQFEAGMLPTINVNNKNYYVDGRLQQLRNIKDFSDTINFVDDNIFNSLSETDKAIIVYEFEGEII
jgi:hypothetical protein